MRTCPISKAAASQRTGRAGRTRPGVCYRLYTRTAFDSLPPLEIPEVQRVDFTTTALSMLSLGIQDLAHFDFQDPPAPAAVSRALSSLHFLGMVDMDGRVTPTGTEAAGLPVAP